MTIKEHIAYMTQVEYDALPQEKPLDEHGGIPHGAAWITTSWFNGEPTLAFHNDPEGHLNRWNFLGTGMTMIYRIQIVESLPLPL